MRSFNNIFLVVFSSFSFEQAVNPPKRKRGPEPREQHDRLWSDGSPRVARSADGVDLLYHIPYFLTPKENVCASLHPTISQITLYRKS